MDRRVVITGTGILTAVADSRRELHQALCEGRCGLQRIDRFDAAGLSRPLAGEIVSFSPQRYLGEGNFRPLDRTSQLLASAARLALTDSGWTEPMLDEDQAGLVVGTTFCSMHTISQFDCRALVEGPSRASALDFANTVINAAAGQTAIWHKLRRVNSTISAGITSGLAALAYAFDLIRDGHETAILAGGVEELCMESLLAFERSGLTCTSGGDEPRAIPFDARRNGFAVSEAAALVMLEEHSSAVARGANILAEIKGHGSRFDCSDPDGDTHTVTGQRTRCIARAMQLALDDAGLSPGEIGAVSASANGSVLNDRAEARALDEVFNGRSFSLPVTAPKALLGESLGASAAVQTVAAVEALASGLLPGISGLEETEAASPASLTAECRRVERDHCLVSSVGIDGNCSALVLAGQVA